MKKNIPYSELEFSVMRSRGSGGQSVNRTNSAVQLKWNPFTSTVLSEAEKMLLVKNLKLQENESILIRVEQNKSQDLNKKLAINLLHKKIEKGLFQPKVRKNTRMSPSQKAERLRLKKLTSEKKSIRQKKWD